MPTGSSQHQILEVARSLFTERGFANVSMRDICREARVTAPTVYYYFKNKEALWDAVVRETVTMADFTKRLKLESGKVVGPRDQIQIFIRTYLSSFPMKLINTGLYLRDSTQLDEVGKRTLVSELARIDILLTGLIRRGIAQGEFRQTDPRMAAELLLGMMNRFVFQQIHFRRNYKPTEASTYLADFFLKAMSPRAEQRSVT